MLCSKVRNVRSKDRVLSDLVSRGTHSLKGMTLLGPRLCGKAIKLLLSTLPPFPPKISESISKWAFVSEEKL